MVVVRRFLISLVLFALGFGGLSAQSVQEFDPAGAGLPLFRPAGGTPVKAIAQEEWLTVPTDAHDMLGDYRFLPHYATEDTRGQVFEVVRIEDGYSLVEPGDRFVGVPWTVGCGCADEGWDQPGWVSPGDTVVFLLTPTRARVPWAGPPVFDVLGWHQPYPSGDFVRYWRHTRLEPPEWLSTDEFFDLLTRLPGESAFRLDPSTSKRAVDGWLQDNPDREEAFPMPTILWELERLLGDRSMRRP
jgi:hypothetical protein